MWKLKRGPLKRYQRKQKGESGGNEGKRALVPKFGTKMSKNVMAESSIQFAVGFAKKKKKKRTKRRGPPFFFCRVFMLVFWLLFVVWGGLVGAQEDCYPYYLDNECQEVVSWTAFDEEQQIQRFLVLFVCVFLVGGEYGKADPSDHSNLIPSPPSPRFNQIKLTISDIRMARPKCRRPTIYLLCVATFGIDCINSSAIFPPPGVLGAFCKELGENCFLADNNCSFSSSPSLESSSLPLEASSFEFPDEFLPIPVTSCTDGFEDITCCFPPYGFDSAGGYCSFIEHQIPLFTLTFSQPSPECVVACAPPFFSEDKDRTFLIQMYVYLGLTTIVVLFSLIPLFVTPGSVFPLSLSSPFTHPNSLSFNNHFFIFFYLFFIFFLSFFIFFLSFFLFIFSSPRLSQISQILFAPLNCFLSNIFALTRMGAVRLS